MMRLHAKWPRAFNILLVLFHFLCCCALLCFDLHVNIYDSYDFYESYSNVYTTSTDTDVSFAKAGWPKEIDKWMIVDGPTCAISRRT